MEFPNFILELQHKTASRLMSDSWDSRQLLDISRLNRRDQVGHRKSRQYTKSQFGSDAGHAGQQHKCIFFLRRQKTEKLNRIFTDMRVYTQRDTFAEIGQPIIGAD